jgi:hypothetical protein
MDRYLFLSLTNDKKLILIFGLVVNFLLCLQTCPNNFLLYQQTCPNFKLPILEHVSFWPGLPYMGQNNNNNNIIIIMLKQRSQDPFMCGTGTKTETKFH